MGGLVCFPFEYQEVAKRAVAWRGILLTVKSWLTVKRVIRHALSDRQVCNVISHFDSVTPLIESGKYDLYLDTSLEYSEDSALQIGNSFANKIRLYHSLSSLSPASFGQETAHWHGSQSYELDNLAYGLEIPRDLALQAVIKAGNNEVLHEAQKIDADLMNKDTDGDDYSDGLELTYWTNIDDDTDFPAF